MNSAIDPLFNSLKIRYEIMDKIFNENEVTIHSSDVNVYIDLDSLFRSIFTPLVAGVVRSGDDVDYKTHVKNMVANILNLASHYRRYFTKIKKYSRIFLLSSHPFNDLRTANNYYIEEYRKNFNMRLKEPQFNLLLNVLLESFNVMRVIIDYIEDLFLITSSSIETAIIPKVINDIVSPNTDTTFIITKDNYYYQYLKSDNYYIIRPKFNNESYLIKTSTLIDTVKKEANVNTHLSVNSSFFVFIKTIIGDKNRSIPKISGVGVAKILKLLVNSIEENYISGTCNDIYGLSKLVDKKDQQKLLNNYLVTDIDYQTKVLSLSDKNSIKMQLINKFDNVSLQKLNDELFTNHPINLMDLTGHIKLKYVKKHNYYNIFRE